MNNKVVIFGPWVGEFSYEISWWIPEIRELANTKYKNYDVVHVGYNGRKGLYKDFIDSYIHFSEEINKEIEYWMPDCHLVRGERDERSGINMPRESEHFFNNIVNDYKMIYDIVETFTPLDNPITADRCYAENPIGEFKHLEVDENVDVIIKNKLKEFNNDREIVCVMARSRDRFGKTDGQTWNPNHWKLFIDKLINELKLNVVMMGVPKRRNYPGSFSFEDTEYLKSFVFEGEDSVDCQISLLKNTKCSIYGASGAATLPFFTDTPMFAQQSRENGKRLLFEWQKRLTNGHRYIKLFDKYSMSNLYDSPVQEMFDEFKEFYGGLS